MEYSIHLNTYHTYWLTRHKTMQHNGNHQGFPIFMIASTHVSAEEEVQGDIVLPKYTPLCSACTIPWQQGLWGQHGAHSGPPTQVGPMLAPWTLLSGICRPRHSVTQWFTNTRENITLYNCKTHLTSLTIGIFLGDTRPWISFYQINFDVM